MYTDSGRMWGWEARLQGTWGRDSGGEAGGHPQEQVASECPKVAEGALCPLGEWGTSMVPGRRGRGHQNELGELGVAITARAWVAAGATGLALGLSPANVTSGPPAHRG